MANEDLRISELFSEHRFPSGLSLFLLIFYFPIGVLLAVFRLFFSLQLMLVLSLLPKTSFIRSILLRVSSTVNGLVVTCEGYENYSQDKQKVVVCNHITSLDNVAMEMILPSVMYESMSPSPWLINKLLGYTDFGGSKEKENLNTRITESLAESNVPLLVFPEESTTCGQKGLLKFNPWSFELCTSVTPVALEVKIPPFPGISQSVLGSGWCSELFWFLFVPFTNYHLRFLHHVSRSESQSVEDFSEAVQKTIATSLGVQPTNFTTQDKSEYIKKLHQERAQKAAQTAQTPRPRAAPKRTPTPSTSSPSRDTRLTRMAQNVKEVLPQVPIDAIQRDLRKTKCVDATITNILEGKVQYKPEVPGQSSPSPNPQAPSPPKSSTAASKFSKVSEERHQSFEERKIAMIEEARKKYMAKHGHSEVSEVVSSEI